MFDGTRGGVSVRTFCVPSMVSPVSRLFFPLSIQRKMWIKSISVLLLLLTVTWAQKFKEKGMSIHRRPKSLCVILSITKVVFIFVFLTLSLFSCSACTNCVDEGDENPNSRWTMPLQKLGSKQYYLGIFFKVRS